MGEAETGFSASAVDKAGPLLDKASGCGRSGEKASQREFLGKTG